MPRNEYDALLEDQDAAPDNPYDALLKQQQAGQQTAMRQSMTQAAKTTPDAHAKVLEVAKRLKVPADVVARNPEVYQQRDALEAPSYERLIRDTPALAEWLQHPDNASLGHDDLEPLGVLETLVQTGARIWPTVKAAGYGTAAGLLGVLEAGREAHREQTRFRADVPEVERARYMLAEQKRLAPVQAARMRMQQRADEATREARVGLGAWGGAVQSGVQSLAQMAPLLAVSAFTKSPAATLFPMGLTTGGQSYGRARDAGKTVDEAIRFGTFDGAVEAATELLPATWWLKDLAKNAPFRTVLLHQLKEELVGENIATVLQDLNEWANLHPDQPFSEYLKERPSAIAETTIATIVTAGGVAALNRVAARGVSGKEPSEQILSLFGDAAKQSKTLQRAPGHVEQLLAGAAKGTGVETVYLPVDTFTSYFQEQGLDPAVVAAQLTGNRDALAESTATGADLAIPLATYVTTIAATEHNAYFAQEARFHPTEMNAREVSAFDAAQAAQEGPPAPPGAPSAELTARRDALIAQLEAAGMERSTAETNVRLAMAFLTEIEQRSGIPVTQTLNVTRAGMGPPGPAGTGGGVVDTAPAGAHTSDLDASLPAGPDAGLDAGLDAGPAGQTEEGRGLSDGLDERGALAEGGPLEGSGDADRASGRRLPGPLDDVYVTEGHFRRADPAADTERLTPEVTRELSRIADELDEFPFEPHTWQWIDQNLGPNDGNAAGGQANIVGGSPGAPVYNDVLAFAPANLEAAAARVTAEKGDTVASVAAANRVTVDDLRAANPKTLAGRRTKLRAGEIVKLPRKMAKTVAASRAAVSAAIRKALETGTIHNNIAEGAVRVAERRAIDDYVHLSRPMLPPPWEYGRMAEASDAVLEVDAVDPETDEVDDSFDVTEFEQGPVGGLFDAPAGPMLPIGTRIDQGSGITWTVTRHRGDMVTLEPDADGYANITRPMSEIQAEIDKGRWTVEQAAAGKPPVDDLFAQADARLEQRERLADTLAAPGVPVTLEGPNGRTVLAGPDMSKPGRFRWTRFENGEPTGHTEAPTLRDAILDALREGYAPKAPAAAATERDRAVVKDEGNGTFTVTLNGREVGRANVADDGRGDYLTSVRVDDAYQRQGIGTKLYDAVEAAIGRPLRPSPTYQTPAAIAFWKSRGATTRAAVVDTLDTGEQQPRLPGAGEVREQHVATPEFDAPFSLTAPVSKGKKGKQTSLFQSAVSAATQAFRSWFGDSKVVDAHGNPRIVYHGTRRLDRFGPVVQKRRATSGPMPFFTADKAVASRYADQKQDTSLDNEDQAYTNWFRFTPAGSKTELPIDRAWYALTPEERARVAALAPRVTSDDTGTPVLGDESQTTGTGGYDQHIKEARGNHLQALVEEWLNSANLFGNEHEFLQVLALAGVPVERVAFHDPHADRAGVVPVYLSIQRPLATAEITDEEVARLEARAKRVRRPADTAGSDAWDKRTRDAREWVQQLKADRAAGVNSFVWSSIPDWVTDELKAMGYDGIHDTGGKTGGVAHDVWIPFEPGQVKSATGNRGTFNRGSRNILNQSAYHGSPHIFDAFSTKAIGSGEGAQVYGWGLYFAGKKAVAEYYRRALTSEATHEFEALDQHENVMLPPWVRNRIATHNDKAAATEAAIADFEARIAHERDGLVIVTPEEAAEAAATGWGNLLVAGQTRSSTPWQNEDNIRGLQIVVDALTKLQDSGNFTSKALPKGRLYKVDIPDADRYLDWDKPFDAQPPQVQEALKALGADSVFGPHFEPALAFFKSEIKAAADERGLDGDALAAIVDRMARSRNERTNEANLDTLLDAFGGDVTGVDGKPIDLNRIHDLASFGLDQAYIQHLIDQQAQPLIDDEVDQQLQDLEDRGLTPGAVYTVVEGEDEEFPFEVHDGDGFEVDSYSDRDEAEAAAQEENDRVRDDFERNLRTDVANDLDYDEIERDVRRRLDLDPDTTLLNQVDEAGDSGDSGEGYYKQLVRRMQSGTDQSLEEQASRALSAAGVAGIRYLDASSRGAGDGTHNYVVFDDALVKVLEYEQPARGVIRFGPDRQFNIELLKGADLSTFLHESAHFYLEVFGDVAEQLAEQDPSTLTDQQRKMLADYGALLGWFGVENRNDIEEQHHEQFARGFEAYLMEGKAPSAEMRSIFARVRTWLLGVYREIKRLNVTLTPEVRGVFDRLLASDEAIAAAEQEADIRPLFSDAKAAGVSQDEFDLYRGRVQAASDKARDALAARLLRDHQREQAAWWKAEREKTRDAVTAEVHAQPVYQALAAMRSGTHPDGTPLVEGEEPVPQKLSKAVIVDEYGKDRLAALPKPYLYTVTDGLHPDTVAERYGFDSGDALLQAVTAAPPMARVIEAETNRRMLEAHGDTRLDGSLPAQAEADVHDQRETVVRAELQALAKQRREVTPFVKQAVGEATRERAYERQWLEAEAKLRIAIAEGHKQVEIDALKQTIAELKAQARAEQRARTRAAATVPPAALLRQVARERIARTPVRALTPGLYLQAAHKASTEALKALAKGDIEATVRAKQQELLNLALYRMGRQARETADAARDYLQSFTKSSMRQRVGKAGHDYLDQIDGYLDRYELAHVSQKVLDRRKALRAWVSELEGDGLPVDLPENVLDDARRVNWRELTLEELEGVRDAVKQIAHLARLKNTLLKSAQQRELEETSIALDASIRAHKTQQPSPIETRLPTDAAARAVHGWLAAHRKIASLAREMDGFEDGGAAWEAFIRPINAAADVEAQMNADATKALSTIFNTAFPGRQMSRLYTKRTVPGTTLTLTDMGRIVIALNWGNEGNRQRVQTDKRWTAPQLQAVLDSLTAKEWDFVEQVWDFVDSYWPQIHDKQQRVVGVAPQKVEAVPFTVLVDGVARTIRGGYYPLKYEDRLSAKASRNLDLDAANLQKQAAYVKATTRRGHTQARAEKVTEPIRTDFGTLFEHVQQVIHDLSHHEMLIDMGRLLGDARVQRAIYDVHGDQVFKTLKKAVQDIAFGDAPTTEAFERAINHLRTGTTVAALGWNVTTSLMQPLGLTQAAVRIGPQWVGRGIVRWLRSPRAFTSTPAWINERSTFMRLRAQTQQREINEIRNTSGLNTGRFAGWIDEALSKTTFDMVTKQGIVDSFFWMIAQAQRVADIPTWLGAYEKAMNADPDEARAIALADQAVIDSQGGGQIKDMASVQRGGPLLKIWTNFYSIFNATWNLTVEETKRTNFKNPFQVGRLAADYLMLYIVPATLGFLIKRALRGGGGDDDEPPWSALVAENLSYLMGTMLGLRELSGAVQGYTGYEGPAGTRFFSSASKFVKQTQQGEVDAAFLRAFNDTAGTLLHYPAGQIRRSIDGYAALREGTTENPLALIVGPPPKE